jgi:hypothetical protein
MLNLRSLAFIRCSAIRRSCALSCSAAQCFPDRKIRTKAESNEKKMATNRATCISVSYEQYTLDNARRLVAGYVDDYSDVRLNTALVRG